MFADDAISECLSFLPVDAMHVSTVRLLSSHWATLAQEMPPHWNAAFASREGCRGGSCLVNVSTSLGQSHLVELELALSSAPQVEQLAAYIQSQVPRFVAHHTVEVKLVLVVDFPTLFWSFAQKRGCGFDWPQVAVDLRFSRGINDAVLLHTEGDEMREIGRRFGRSVTSLNISRSRSLSEAGLVALTSQLEWAGLKSLDISVMNKKFSSEALTSLANISTLTSLKLRELDDEGLITLATTLKLQSSALTALDVTDCHALTDDGIGQLVAVELPELRSIKMKDCRQLTDSALAHLAQRGRMTSLSLNGKKYTELGFAQLGFLSQMEALDLEQCFGLTDKAIGLMLAPPPSSSSSSSMALSLRTLNIGQCENLTNSSLLHVSLCWKQLQHLNLSYCRRISDDGLLSLAPLSQLQSLLLCGCILITDAGVAAALTGKPHMRKLGMSMCVRVTDAGLGELAAMTDLESLDIAGLGVTDVTIARVAKLPRLKFLYLRCCEEITDEGMKALGGLRRLELVDIGGCSRISNEGQSALPSTATIAL